MGYGTVTAPHSPSAGPRRRVYTHRRSAVLVAFGGNRRVSKTTVNSVSPRRS